MYCLRLFIVVLHCLLQRLLLLLLCVPIQVCVYQVSSLIGCCVSESKGNLCLYRNVWPEALFFKNYIGYRIVYILV